MEILIGILQFFLVFIGGISIIGSLMDIGRTVKESDSEVATKWFKWKGPVRLVFGLICIVSVIVINKIEFFSINDSSRIALENKIEDLQQENNKLRKILNGSDSLGNFYQITVEDKTAKSILNGNILIAYNMSSMKINGATLLDDSLKQIKEDRLSVRTGEKYFFKFRNKVYGLNILHSDINTDYLKIEVFSVDR